MSQNSLTSGYRDISLLGGLFEHRARIRAPLDPSRIVLRLDDYERRMDYFDKESAWGKYRTNMHQDTLAQLARE